MIFELAVIFLSLIFLCSLLIIAFQWGKLSQFFHTHYTYSNLLFMLLYAYEQALFIVIPKRGYDFLDNDILIGLFALIVLTTVGVHILMMESRYKKVAQSLDQLTAENLRSTKDLITSYDLEMERLRNQIVELEEDNTVLSDYIINKKRLKK